MEPSRLCVEPFKIRLKNPRMKARSGHVQSHWHLLRDPDVRRWHQNLENKSPVTANVYLRRLGWFCRRKHINPRRLAAMDEDEATDLLIDMVADLQKSGRAGSYIKSIVKALRSWMKHHRKHLGEVNVARAGATPTLHSARPPMQEELATILRAAGQDARVAVSLVSQTGIRLGVLGNHEGNDGLRLKDLEGIEIDNDAKTVKFTVPPSS
jgi:hypothetical protein